MHGYFGWKNPRFEDFEYTSWLPSDDTMAWLGNGNTVAEFTDVGDTTNYMDYSDISKVLPVPTDDYNPPPIQPSVAVNGGVSHKQHVALENIDETPTPNTAIDPQAAPETKIAASEEVAPLGSPAAPGNQAPLLDGETTRSEFIV